jgi:hypothetical protein
MHAALSRDLILVQLAVVQQAVERVQVVVAPRADVAQGRFEVGAPGRHVQTLASRAHDPAAGTRTTETPPEASTPVQVVVAPRADVAQGRFEVLGGEQGVVRGRRTGQGGA